MSGRNDGILLMTTDSVPGGDIGRVIGLVTGSALVSKNMTKNYMSGVPIEEDGEISAYTNAVDSAQKIAVGRMEASEF